MPEATHADHICNLELIKIARHTLGGFHNTVKQAFIPAGDPSGGMGGGGGAPPGGGDPSGGAAGPPPGDPSGGMGGGGAPPPPPGGGGGGGDDILSKILQNMQQMQQQMQMMSGGAGGGGAGGAGGIKPKIDVNVEMMQIKNMLAKICDQLGIQIPAQDMVATPDKLMAMSQGQSTSTPTPGGGGDPSGGGAIGGISPMQGMQPAGQPGMPPKTGSYKSNGSAFDPDGMRPVGYMGSDTLDSSGLTDTMNKAAAIARLRKAASA